MSGEITKEVLVAFTDSNNKVAGSLEKISGCLIINNDQLTKITDRLYNGLGKEITKEIIDTVVGVGAEGEKTTLLAIKKDTSNNRQNIEMSKIFIGAIALIIVIVVSIVNVVTRQAQLGLVMKEAKEAREEIQKEQLVK